MFVLSFNSMGLSIQCCPIIQYNVYSSGHNPMQGSMQSSPGALLPNVSSAEEVEPRLIHSVNNSANDCLSNSSSGHKSDGVSMKSVLRPLKPKPLRIDEPISKPLVSPAAGQLFVRCLSQITLDWLSPNSSTYNSFGPNSKYNTTEPNDANGYNNVDSFIDPNPGPTHTVNNSANQCLSDSDSDHESDDLSIESASQPIGPLSPGLQSIQSLLFSALNPLALNSCSYDSFGPNETQDMSKQNDVNVGYSVDSVDDTHNQTGEEPTKAHCVVCGDYATGYHYNALSCEGCKGFFQRIVSKKKVYKCKKRANCEINMYMRRKCRYCRYMKCLAFGMCPESVGPKGQSAANNQSLETQGDKHKPITTTTIEAIRVDNIDPKPLHLASNTVNNDFDCLSVLQKLTEHQRHTILWLLYFQDALEIPPKNDIESVTPFSWEDSESGARHRYLHVIEMTVLTVYLIVDCAKRMPGFGILCEDDQITLLKASSSEIMMLRASRRYDYEIDAIVYASGKPYTREHHRMASVGHTTEVLFGFCRWMSSHNLDNTEYALITGIVLFNERPNLFDAEKVAFIRDSYADTLKAWVNIRRPADTSFWANLNEILTKLQTLAVVNFETCTDLRKHNILLPPLLVEIWDIPE